MDLRDKTVSPKRRPWDFPRRTNPMDDSDIDPRDLRPWEIRQWFIDPSCCSLAELHQEWQNGTAVGVVAPPPTGSPLYSYDEVEKVWQIAEETGCTIVEAAISVKGADSFPPQFMQRILKSPDQCVADTNKPQATVIEESPDVVFVDPAAAVKPKRPAKASKAKKGTATRRGGKPSVAVAEEPIPTNVE